MKSHYSYQRPCKIMLYNLLTSAIAINLRWFYYKSLMSLLFFNLFYLINGHNFEGDGFISYRRSLIINLRMDGIQYYNIRMFKKTVFFLLCTVLILSQNLRGKNEHLIGGYQSVNPKF